MGSISEPNGCIIVVGAGYGGLATAIELRRKKLEVLILESVPELTTQGDIIQIGSSATKVMASWGNVLQNVQAESAQPPVMSLLDRAGKEILKAPLPKEFNSSPVLFSNRGSTQRHIYNYAISVGVKFRFNCKVTGYFEDESCAGVIVGDERIKAAGVIACDGIHSTARQYITGIQKKARTSGFAVYRSWFSLDRLAEDTLTKHFAESKEDQFLTWIGPDTHVILFITISVRGAVIFVTHKDNAETAESWTFKGDHEDMLKNVEGWDPVIEAAVRAIPADNVIDWKLLWRDPTKRWVSHTGRIAIAGDAAHPHLPTSGSGATQAIEDATTLAALLDRIGTEKLPTSFRVFEKLRYERTALTQRMGWETRHRWHQTDWEAVKRNPEYLKMPQPLWLYCHDAEKYAYERCDEAVKSLQDEIPFQSSNLPEGYVHEDWTVEMMMALESKQAEEHFYKIANQ